MDFDEWLAAKGFPQTLTAQQKQTLQAAWRAETNGNIPYAQAADFDPVELAEPYLDTWRGDETGTERVAAVARTAAAEGWNRQRTQLELVRASRPIVRTERGGSTGANVLEAGLLLHLGMPDKDVARHFGDRVTDAATGRNYRSISIHGLMRCVLAAGGRHVPPGGFNDQAIREAFEVSEMMASSGPSTITIGGILSNVANKLALMAFQNTVATWPKWCRTRSAKDFKQMTSYRLAATGGGRLVEIPAGGEIEHGSLEESDYTNQVDQYGKMLVLDRKDIINDDLAMLQSVPNALGRLGQVSLERAVYVLLLANTGSFFHANNANLITGAGSVLALAGLDDAIEALEEMLDGNGDPILMPPAILLVPPALHATGRSLVNSQAIVDGTATDRQPDGNPWRGMLEPVSSAYLGSTVGLTGASDAAWYVMVGPSEFSPVEVAFLNGVSSPTIESATLDFDKLGIGMRVIFDFGVAFAEPKGAIKNQGS